MLFRRAVRAARFIIMVILAILLLAPEWSATASEQGRLQSIVRLRDFDYLVWEVDALLDKAKANLAAGHLFIDAEIRKDIVLDYLQLVKHAQSLEAELRGIYGNPDVLNPDFESRAVQDELDEVRTTIKNQQPLAEAILQEQVATILDDQGFNLLGYTWPPVMMHVTPLPSLLVVSPRERIEKLHEVSLESGLTTPENDDIERQVLAELDRSALVVPLAGIGTYPAMIRETSDINRLAEVVAHEWSHHWLTLHPLGFSYAFDPNLRIINETVASLIDEEIADLVVRRYYPELLPPAQSTGSKPLPEEPEEPAPPAFDFQNELAATRIEVEELLAVGQIDEAEQYMEERRQQFRDNGYYIRKLNQAYFAFYGAYAAEPGGAQGENPIGPMLRDIRAHSPSIIAFLETVAPITSLDELVEIHEQIVPPDPSASEA